MPEELFAIRPNEAGGQGDFSRKDIRMAILAVRRWGVSDEKRRSLSEEVYRIVKDSPEDKTKLLAIKLAIEMDKVDAKREENEMQERHHEVLEATAVLRTAMQGPEMREQLARLSDHICNPIPIEVQHEIDEVATADAQHVLEIMNRLPDNHVNGNGKK
jgi:hypothetical protein